jgi:hypothetical protein
MRPAASALALAAAAVSLPIAAASILGYVMMAMPGQSHTGVLPPLSAEERELAARLKRHVTAIALGERNLHHPQALEAAARYIKVEVAALGLPVQRHTFETALGTAHNVETSVAGESGELIVVGAHYDTHPGSPGANDNASGVAAALELARLARGAALQRTLRFVWFANEEWPFFGTEDMGSRRYVGHLERRGDRLAGMFSLETIGYYSDAPGTQRYPFAPLSLFYPDTGNFVAFVGNLASRALVRESIRAFRRHARFPSEGIAAPAFIEGVDWSDHASFWEAGYPALMITDTAPFRYPHYHLPSDTPEKVDYERLARVVTGLHGMLRELAGGAP